MDTAEKLAMPFAQRKLQPFAVPACTAAGTQAENMPFLSRLSAAMKERGKAAFEKKDLRFEIIRALARR